MSNNIIRFPGFILLDDRNTILKDGKRYKSMRALIDDLPYQDLKLTYQWRIKQRLKIRGITNPTTEDIHAAGVLDYRARTLRDARMAILAMPISTKADAIAAVDY